MWINTVLSSDCLVGKRLLIGLQPEDHYRQIFSVFSLKQDDTDFIYLSN